LKDDGEKDIMKRYLYHANELDCALQLPLCCPLFRSLFQRKSKKQNRKKQVAAKTSGPPSASAATDPATNEKK